MGGCAVKGVKMNGNGVRKDYCLFLRFLTVMIWSLGISSSALGAGGNQWIIEGDAVLRLISGEGVELKRFELGKSKESGQYIIRLASISGNKKFACRYIDRIDAELLEAQSDYKYLGYPKDSQLIYYDDKGVVLWEIKGGVYWQDQLTTVSADGEYVLFPRTDDDQDCLESKRCQDRFWVLNKASRVAVKSDPIGPAERTFSSTGLSLNGRYGFVRVRLSYYFFHVDSGKILFKSMEEMAAMGGLSGPVDVQDDGSVVGVTILSERDDSGNQKSNRKLLFKIE